MNYDPTDIRAQERRTQEQQRQQEIALEQAKDDFLSLMATAFGRRFMWDLLARCGVFTSSFRTSAEMAFLEGKRVIGLQMLERIHALCPERYVEMLNEAKERT